MTVFKHIFFALLVLTAETTSAQQLASQSLDTTISIFWSTNLKIRIQILDPDEQDIKKKNTVLTLCSLDPRSRGTIYRDSIFVYTLQFKMMDVDGDGIRDFLIYNTNNGPENLNYHLYLVDQKLGRLTRVKRFEKVFNPYYDQSKCLLLGFESFEKKLILNLYQIDKKGTLSITTAR